MIGGRLARRVGRVGRVRVSSVKEPVAPVTFMFVFFGGGAKKTASPDAGCAPAVGRTRVIATQRSVSGASLLPLRAGRQLR